MVRWVLLGAVLVAAMPDAPPASYDLEWQTVASVSRLEGTEVRAAEDSLQGTATLTLTEGEAGTLTFSFTGPGGSGTGIVNGDALESMTFPTPDSVGLPPFPPHALGGRYSFEGERTRPSRFALYWVEAFYCRTDPRACDGVTAWERRFTGTATRVTRDARARPPRPTTVARLTDAF